MKPKSESLQTYWGKLQAKAKEEWDKPLSCEEWENKFCGAKTKLFIPGDTSENTTEIGKRVLTFVLILALSRSNFNANH
jgi:hypothetical protein